MKEITEQARAAMLSMLKHDLNNVLTGVKTGLEIMAMDDYFEDPEHSEDMQDVLKASKRLSHMIEDLSLIYADLSMKKSTPPAINVKTIQQNYQNQCEQNRLYPILSHDIVDHQIALDSNPLIRGLIYLTQVLQDLNQTSCHYTIIFNNDILKLCFSGANLTAEHLRHAFDSNEEHPHHHKITMFQQSLAISNARHNLESNQLIVQVPATKV